jgi:acetyl-CoA C-acetyltransferase
MPNREVVLSAPLRTAIGTFGGALKETTATELGATAVRAVLARSKLDHAKVQTVVMGNVVQAGNKMNSARQAAIHGGLPVEVPAMTVNRVCGSGAQAIASAAQEIMLGYIDCALAGGMENMDRAPYLMGSARWGYRLGDAQIYDSMLRDGLNDALSDQHSGWHTEDLVTSRQIKPSRRLPSPSSASWAYLRISSTWKAARLRMGIRSAPPVRFSRRGFFIR